MATVIEVQNMRQGYVNIVQQVYKTGHDVSPRGQLTRELLDAIIVVDDPTDSLPLNVGRALNPTIGAIEALQLVGGFTDATAVVRLVPAMKPYTEDDGTFWGAYGTRIANQMREVEAKLVMDPDTRQAVVTLWVPWKDNVTDKRDYPCTTMLQFLIRGDKLIMHTTMRSNDVWWGLAYDVFQFTQLQLTLAAALGIEAGPYHHHAVSLHLYERDFEHVYKLDLFGTSKARFGPIGLPGQDMQGRMSRARDLLYAFEMTDLTEHEAWLRQVTREKIIGG